MKIQNLKDFLEAYSSNGGKKAHLYALISKQLGVHQNTVRNWFNLKTTTDNPVFLSQIEKTTGIKRESMFIHHD